MERIEYAEAIKETTLEGIMPFAPSEASRARIAWAYVLAKEIREVGFLQYEFFAFAAHFMDQFPHDWDGKEFMGVKLIRL